MENAEERKKMKKIEKEEQLKKKLEQTMEEKMAADSKTVEGESAVVKAEEGNTATEQEAAPALSEEELNAMYERFQQRLQKEGLADAEGNPTEKTLEIRRQIVEKKVEREKQAERQKKIAKRAKTTKHWVQTAKAAGVVLVVGACVFGASMTSEANRIRLVESVHGVWNAGSSTGTDNGETRKYSTGSLDEAQKEIRENLHIEVPEFYYIPKGMEYNRTYISKETKLAIIQYKYGEKEIYFRLSANENDLSQSDWQDSENVEVETFDNILDIEMGTISENDEKNYYVKWRYKDVYYEGCGIENQQEYETKKNNMLASIYKNNGFWISQYIMKTEANRTNSSDSLIEPPVSKDGLNDYNYVTVSQAQNLANNLNIENKTSSLMFGIQWDLMLKYIEKSKSNAENASILNIYDLSGNMYEWTLEQNINDGENIAVARGAMSERNSKSISSSISTIGFRVTLY